jgi:hypothetical protein
MPSEFNKDIDSTRYFNICCTLNEMINTFYYVNNRLTNIDEPWIFLVRSDYIKDFDRYNKIADINMTYYSLNSVVKKLNNLMKYQLKLQQSLYHQSNKWKMYKYMNTLRTINNSRFKSESLKTTDRIHKQRTENIKKQIAFYEQRNGLLKHNIHEIFLSFICLIKNFLKELYVPVRQIQTPVETSIDIINSAWELTQTDLDLLLEDIY